MRFENLQYLYLLFLIPLMISFFIWSGRKRQRDLNRLANTPLLENLLRNYRQWEGKLRAGFIITGVFFLLIALLGPQWGFRWEKAAHIGVDIVIGVDISKSMLAEDVRPNRLERAKLAIQDLIGDLEGDRVGLVTFAGTSFLQVPLTVDYNAFMQGVQSLSPDMIPQGGTAIGEAMENALKAFDNTGAENRLFILITDGENHQGDPIKLAQKFEEEGVQLIVIGMGTIEGELIPVMQDNCRQFLKDKEGNVVKSRLDEDLLKNLAQTASGVYLSGTDIARLDSLYAQFIGNLKKSEFNTEMKKNFYHRYQIFLLIGIILIGLEMLVGVKRGRKS
ncbi:MAG: VWA domain-containing protein [Halanaerobiales bacterium]|nr:VWA domain-containing protein [Halanaerobiales bacterium]